MEKRKIVYNHYKTMSGVIALSLVVIAIVAIIFAVKMNHQQVAVSPVATTMSVSTESASSASAKETLLEQVKRLGIWENLSEDQKSFVLVNSTRTCGNPIFAAEGSVVTITDGINNKVLVQTHIRDSQVAGVKSAINSCKKAAASAPKKQAPSTKAPASVQTQEKTIIIKQQPSPTPSSAAPSSSTSPVIINNRNENNVNVDVDVDNNNRNNNHNDNGGNTNNNNNSNSNSNNNNNGNVSSKPSSSREEPTPSSEEPKKVANSRLVVGSAYRICDIPSGKEIKANILIYTDEFIDPETIQSHLSASGLKMEGTVRYDGKNANGRVYVVYYTIPNKAGTYNITLSGTDMWKAASASTKVY